MFATVFIYYAINGGNVRFSSFDFKLLRTLLYTGGIVIIISGFPSLSVFVDKAIASTVGDGSVAGVTYAYKIVNLPIYLVSMSVVRVAIPTLTRQLALYDLSAAKALTLKIIKLIACVGMGATLLGLLLSRPVVSLLFERGSFSMESADIVASCLHVYCFGIPAMAINAFFLSFGYASKKYKTAFLILLLQFLTGVLCSMFFVQFTGARGVALGNVIANWGALFVWILIFWGKNGLFSIKKLEAN
jgi:putative peptidoglycan lipid II flippase